MRLFIQKYCRQTGSLPRVSTLCKDYVKLCLAHIVDLAAEVFHHHCAFCPYQVMPCTHCRPCSRGISPSLCILSMSSYALHTLQALQQRYFTITVHSVHVKLCPAHIVDLVAEVFHHHCVFCPCQVMPCTHCRPCSRGISPSLCILSMSSYALHTL